jgi:hypothetical protein
MKAINVILDYSDGPNRVFVEIESDEGRSLRIGTLSRVDDLVSIRITPEDIINASTD